MITVIDLTFIIDMLAIILGVLAIMLKYTS